MVCGHGKVEGPERAKSSIPGSWCSAQWLRFSPGRPNAAILTCHPNQVSPNNEGNGWAVSVRDSQSTSDDVLSHDSGGLNWLVDSSDDNSGAGGTHAEARPRSHPNPQETQRN